MNSKFVSTVVLALAIGLFFSYVQPTWNDIQSIRDVMKSDEDAVTAVNEFNNKKDELKKVLDSIDPANLAKIDAMLPSSVDTIKDVLMIDALGKKAGLKISNIDVQVSKDAAADNRAQRTAATESITLTVSAEGNYAAFNTFLSGLERSQTLFDVRDLSVTGSNTGVYKYALSIRSYWKH